MVRFRILDVFSGKPLVLFEGHVEYIYVLYGDDQGRIYLLSLAPEEYEDKTPEQLYECVAKLLDLEDPDKDRDYWVARFKHALKREVRECRP